MAFLRNYWYAGGWAKDIGQEPFARIILSEAVVFFRRADGSLAAIEDRCCHRALPLSMGTVIGDNIQCGYHGLEFDGDGACVLVPGQSKIPPGASVRSYPVIEKWNVAWIWMGDPALADEAEIPDVWWLDHPDWTPVMGCLHMKADYRLLVDNLMDFTHVSYLHTKTISGDASDGLVAVDTTRDGDRVTVGRWMLDVTPPPMFVAAGGFKGNVDRWQIVNWQAPAAIYLDIGCADAGSGAPDGDRSKGISMWSTHLITPETETSTYYHWCYARNYKQDDAETSRLLAEGGHLTFMEDVEILEIQQDAMLARPEIPMVDINIDNGPMQVRRITADLLQSEQGAQAAE
jgi:phenylpropionate dioxygenase-like ring-hydroxylating dioxygenase large terminal subunit